LCPESRFRPRATQVDPDKVICGFETLKDINICHKDMVVPSKEDLPVPVTVKEN